MVEISFFISLWESWHDSSSEIILGWLAKFSDGSKRADTSLLKLEIWREQMGVGVMKMSVWVAETFLTPAPPWHTRYSLWQHPGFPAGLGARGHTISSLSPSSYETQLLPSQRPKPMATAKTSDPGEGPRQTCEMSRKQLRTQSVPNVESPFQLDLPSLYASSLSSL